MEILNKLLSDRNANICIGDNNNKELKWIIKESKFGGRGLFATTDITAGEIIFKDKPTTIGPRTCEEAPGCSACLISGRPLIACPKGCGLPVCYNRQCFEKLAHREDCKILRDLAKSSETEPGHWSPQLYKGLTLLRCLRMNDKEKEIIKHLYGNKGNQINMQILQLKKSLPSGLSEEDEQWLTHCLAVLDGTSFNVPLTSVGGSWSLRGLYPLAAMMNHSCVPDVRQNYSTGFNMEERDWPTMIVTACRDIPKNAEITFNYCPLLWATLARRKFLLITKQFECTCPRCSDPSEFGTYLSALKCNCGKGILLPLQPLNMASSWQCNSCSVSVNAKTLLIIQTTASQMDMENRCLILPNMNHIIVQAKLETVWKNERILPNLSEAELNENENNIKDLLTLLKQLCLAKSRISGRLLMVLYKTGIEIIKKSVNKNLQISEELKKILTEANSILE